MYTDWYEECKTRREREREINERKMSEEWKTALANAKYMSHSSARKAMS